MATRFARYTPFFNRLRSPRTSHGQSAKSFSLGLLTFATWVPAIVFFNSYVGRFIYINGASMYPYFNKDLDTSLTPDVAWVDKWKPLEGLRRGMIVTLRSPLHPESDEAVKRVIALEGDTVFTREPYPYAYQVVPEGHVWVEGDGGHAGKRTLDSNTYGPISMNLITGRVAWQLLPLERAGRINWWEWKPKTKVIRARKMERLVWT